jgi:butyryl-CoA dehydrogenase
MKFHLTEEHELIRSFVRQFAEEVLASRAKWRDEQALFDRALFAKLGELGLAGILIPERWGGAGGGALSYAVALEELAGVCASTAAALAAHTAFCVWPLYCYGSEQAKHTALNELAGGRKLGGCALPEELRPILAWQREGTDYSLEGTQRSAINAPAADYYTVLAGSASRGSAGVFLLSSSQAGLSLGSAERKLGLRSLPTADLHVAQCRIPREFRLGKAGQYAEMLRSMAALGDIGAAAQSVGLAQAALNHAAQYAGRRIQFGETIGSKQGIAFKLADMTAQVEASRLLVYQAAWLMDNERPFTREAAAARVYAGPAAVAVAIEAVQILGGYGYMRDVGMERLLRDAACTESDYGTGAFNTNPLSRMLAR